MGVPRATLCAAVTAGLFLSLSPGAGAATVWTVTRTDDPPGVGCAPGNCSLRQAIASQNAANGDSVRVPARATPYTLSQALGRIVINKSVTIVGAGARSTTISGGNVTGILAIADPAVSPVVNISGVTLTGGNDAATAPGTPAGGGAIAPAVPLGAPTLTLTDVAVVNNKASATLGNATGGGLSFTSGATVTLRRVLVAGNEVRAAAASATGGGIANGAKLTLVDSTVTGNKAIATAAAGTAFGGGLANAQTATLRGVTLTDNTAVNTGSTSASSGGNLISNTTGMEFLELANTIIAGGSSGQAANTNCSLLGSVPAMSLGGNLDSTNQCGLGATELRNTAPALAPLADNGGPTNTRALLAGSPALHAGAPAACTPTDQRGLPRPAACSIGAFEPQPARTPTVPADRTPPVISGLSLKPRTFRAAKKGATLAAKRRPPVGATVRYTLSEAAVTTFTVLRRTSGRRKGKRCVARTRGNAKARRCARYVAVKGKATRITRSGAQTARFSGRLRGKRLAPGRYRLRLVAVDAARNRSRPVQVRFKIVR
jgi:hypothetical protein